MIVLRVALALVILPCLGGAQKLYSALGLNKDASLSEIKSAYRKLSKEYHPDSAQNAGNAKIKKKYIKIQKAYEVLKDAEKRKEYDETGDLKEGMKEKQEKDHYKFTNLFEDDNDLTEFDGDLDAKLHGEEPWLVFFWSRQAPASMESGNDFKRVAAEYGGVFRSTQVPCDMYNACHQVGGVGLPSMALVHKSSLRWVTGDVNHFSMSEFVKSVLESAVIGRILDVHTLTPESFPLTVPFEFVIFQVSECVDCQAELNVALARYYVMSHSSYRHWMPAIRVATIDCSAYKKLCSMYGVEAYYDEEDEEQFRDLPFSAPRQPWRVAAINPHAHSVRIEGSFFEYEKINGHNVVWLIPKAYSPSQTI